MRNIGYIWPIDFLHKGIALRMAPNEIKKANTITVYSRQSVFAVSLNNGNDVSVTSFEGLIELPGNESGNLFAAGIALPFYGFTN